MPHITVEYTDNLKEETDIHHLLGKINQVFVDRQDIFPVGGIRSRALPLSDYVVADGTHKNDAFVHVTVKIGAGRSEKDKTGTSEAVFEVVTDHFADVYERRYLALSLELVEFSEAGTMKKNNIHGRYRK
ncbi:5-carboxymethyl-2-hydroxymuconate Delta-isomerase [Alteribacter keqinensis]|uniref:5-carboxymethyl-2-hydroxymuconate Delta-isomerase n=1 Tax=Alteribacter keqinensis TaxID=2483800 RepID=A0A3M7TNJ7_9BACI|nr:5-carboxymethyl-2-hydroxymuconate Delta-isomerase [Alteribacter keqinensis]RNA66696.1 5-carboxymethyl-2-hydroxymuconate Delta-isomerase [Alteribacter keqinensis]